MDRAEATEQGEAGDKARKGGRGLVCHEEYLNFYHPGNDKPLSSFKKQSGMMRFVELCAGWVEGEAGKNIMA